MSKVTKRPWGSYAVFMQGNHCVMKELTVQPKQSLSYQYHSYRNEFWYVAFGKGILTLNGQDFEIEHGDTFNILAKDKHMVKNTGNTQLTIYEMQYGSKCDEEDIVRIRDIYGRA